jgi:hypothetical protein
MRGAAFEYYSEGIHFKGRLNIAERAGDTLATAINAPLRFTGDDIHAGGARPGR